ncbi:MAG: META domain-containing protein [Sulfurospirillaceae bacterium]|nr:META domain-containing protein [Sulfurospirillaceae bacterium]MDD2826092.1 META domain-containing protein [Sulfurospirillaceae bacterium]
MKIYNYVIAMIILGVMAGCSSTQIPHETAENNVSLQITEEVEGQVLNETNSSEPLEMNFQEVQWQVIGINGKAIMVQESKPYIKLKLDNSRLQGFGGCNILFGNYILGIQNSVEFPMVASTKRACPNLALEAEFLKMLSEVKSYTIQEGVLLFYDKGNKTIATFEKLD